MTNTDRATLARPGDTDLTVKDPAEDSRSPKAIDRDSEEIGHVADLVADEREGKVRFLQLAAGGFLGLGERKLMVPADG